MIFLAGVPESEALDWDDESQLTEYFTAPVRRFLGDAVDQDETTQVTATIAASHPLAKWREVEMLGQDGPAQGPSKSKPRLEKAQFLSFQDSPEDEHENFLEYSLALLQELESSQIDDGDSTFLDDTTVLPSTSFSTTASTELSVQNSDESMGVPSQQVVTFRGTIMDLKRIPNARHLQMMHPQTMTINILASVISIQPPRTVRVRRTGAEMDIVEVLLGDDTRAGFSISFWLTPVDSLRPFQPYAQGNLRGKLNELRIGDVVVVTHIALSQFRGNVYGQSLSRRMTVNTSLTVLSNHVGGLSGPNAAKLERVRTWSKNFTGKRPTAEDSPDLLRSSTSKRRHSQVELPPDTQF